MRVKTFYRKNLRMSPEKLAAQIAHVVIGLGIYDLLCTIIVLGISDKKFTEYMEDHKEDGFVHSDLGYTEVDAGTITAMG